MELSDRSTCYSGYGSALFVEISRRYPTLSGILVYRAYSGIAVNPKYAVVQVWPRGYRIYRTAVFNLTNTIPIGYFLRLEYYNC